MSISEQSSPFECSEAETTQLLGGGRRVKLCNSFDGDNLQDVLLVPPSYKMSMVNESDALSSGQMSYSSFNSSSEGDMCDARTKVTVTYTSNWEAGKMQSRIYDVKVSKPLRFKVET